MKDTLSDQNPILKKYIDLKLQGQFWQESKQFGEMGWEIFKITNIGLNYVFLQSVSQNMSLGSIKARVLAADICQTFTCTEKF